jgi:hypothetical protein
LAGNQAAINPIVRITTTSSQLSCSATDTAAQEGLFNVGYNYSFETIGSDVKINFELLDTDKVGVVAYLRKQSPFSEIQMANVSGKIFTQIIS